jgi:uncharacterized protein
MSIQSDIKSHTIEAMKARESERVTVLRGLTTAFTNEAVSKGRRPDEELTDEEAIGVISRQVKQRKDSIEQFERGGRPELALSEKSELSILMAYLPEQMSQEDVVAHVRARQAELGLVDASQKNQLMGTVQKELKGKADGSMIKEAVDTLFN